MALCRRATTMCRAGLVLLLAGCSGGGGKINEQLADPVALRDSKTAIALIRIAPPDPSCVGLAVSIGVRDGDLYRPVQTPKLQQLAVTSVAEMILPPGEYHVLGVACYRAKSKLVMAELQGDGRLRRSYAHFTVTAGEVVNLGEIRLERAGKISGIKNSSVDVSLAVSDWPLAEIERFKSQRPKLYAGMHTRLMTVARSQATPEAVADKCAELGRLKAQGKVQNVPDACAAAPPLKRAGKA